MGELLDAMVTIDEVEKKEWDGYWELNLYEGGSFFQAISHDPLSVCLHTGLRVIEMYDYKLTGGRKEEDAKNIYDHGRLRFYDHINGKRFMFTIYLGRCDFIFDEGKEGKFIRLHGRNSKFFKEIISNGGKFVGWG